VVVARTCGRAGKCRRARVAGFVPPKAGESTDSNPARKMVRRVAALLAILFACAVSAYGSATDVWITQGGAGAATGVDLPDAAPYTFLNSHSNCGSGATQIGPGTTVHMSGTFTVSLNGTLVNWMGGSSNPCNGAAGNKIWIKFESGFDCTSVQMGGSPATPAGGCVTVNSSNYIKIGSGASCGATTGGVDSPNSCNATIENTGYGTAFNLPGGVIPASVGIAVYNCEGCEIGGVLIQNLYVQNSPWAISSVSFSGSTGTITCSAACPVGQGIQVNIAGNTLLSNSTTLTVTANNSGGSSFTVSGGPTSGTGTGGTAYDETQQGQQINNTCIYFNNVYSTATSGAPGTGNNWDASVHDFVCHDVGWALYASPAGTGVGLNIHNFVIYDAEHGWADGPSDSSTGTGPIVIHDFHMHDFGNWFDLPALNQFHVDPLHGQVDTTNNPQRFFNNFTVFNGAIDGNMAGATDDLFLRASTTNQLVFNMLLGCPVSGENYTLISYGDGQDRTGFSFTINPSTYNNTVTCNNYFGTLAGSIIYNADTTTPSCTSPYHGGCGFIDENNIWQYGRNPMQIGHGNTYNGAFDYDMVQAVCADANTQSPGSCTGATRPFAGPSASTYASCAITGVCDPGAGSTTPTLQTELGSSCLSGLCAQHDLVYPTATINLGTAGALQAGSPAIHAGANLYSLCNGAAWPLSQLCYDRLGRARPTTGPWDMGATNFAASTVLPPFNPLSVGTH
jgi:hypothetical protein